MGGKGLFAPSRGGLEILDLKTGKTTKTLIPRVAEGVFSVKVFFTDNDKHVVYYHSGHRTIRLFRVSDGKMLANYKASAEVKVIVSNPEGTAVVLGAVDGSLTTLAIADPEDEEHVDVLEDLPSRAITVKPPAARRPQREAGQRGGYLHQERRGHGAARWQGLWQKPAEHKSLEPASSPEDNAVMAMLPAQSLLALRGYVLRTVLLYSFIANPKPAAAARLRLCSENKAYVLRTSALCIYRQYKACCSCAFKAMF